MHELQNLGEELVALSAEQLASLGLPERLLDAVVEAKRIAKFGARRRQLQYIGRLMREVEAAPIQAKLDAWRGSSRTHTAWLHQLERWRERLLADENALPELLAAHPGADVQHLRKLVRNARQEEAAGKPPRSFRALFQALAALIPEPGDPA